MFPARLMDGKRVYTDNDISRTCNYFRIDIQKGAVGKYGIIVTDNAEVIGSWSAAQPDTSHHNKTPHKVQPSARPRAYADEPNCGVCGSKKKRKVSDYIHGAVGILKSEAGVGRAGAEVINARVRRCRNCPTGDYDGFGGCEACGCILPVKVTLSKETCPKGHW